MDVRPAKERTMAAPRIIVTDHDLAYLTLIQELLTEEGYTDVQCIVEPDVVARIEQAIPDLVLMDINPMNADCAWNNLAILRLKPSTTHIPVIICSTDGRMLREKAAWLHDVRCDTLEKPFDLEQLLAKVRLNIASPLRSKACGWSGD
jgi:CheY-like chemotaxis protein